MARKFSMISSSWDHLSELQREAEWRKCAADFTYFAEHYFAIKVPGKGQQPLVLRDAQRDTARIWQADRFSITLKARQIGFSTLAAADALWNDMFFDDREIIFLSKTGADARKLLSIVTYAWKAMPAEMRDRAGTCIRSTVDTFELDNGSKIQSLNSNNPARGYSAFKIYVDEAAFFEKFDQAWSAIEPAADIGGRIHVLSTANGVGNGYHEMWVKAVTGVSGYTPIFYPWSASGRDQAWFDQKCRSMPEWQRAQEYPSTAEEAFIKSGRPVFDIAKFDGVDLCTPEFKGYLDGGPSRPVLEVTVDGELHVWVAPVVGEKYVIGADVAEGLSHGDYSVAEVISVKTGRVVAKWRGHVDPDTFGDETLYDLARWYNRALVGVEVNNHGYATCQALKKRYGNQYMRTSYDERQNIQSRRLGWRTDVKSKRLAIDELRSALRDGEIKLHDAECVGELQTFVRGDDGKMHGSPYDDQVMALAIANQMRKHWFTRTEAQANDISGTFAELEHNIRVRELGEQGNFIIGGHSGSSFARGL